MAINFHTGPIEEIAKNTARVRTEKTPLSDIQKDVAVQMEQLRMEAQAAVKQLANTERTAKGEMTYGSATIAGVSASKGAMAILADFFAPATNKGRSI